MLWLAKRWRWHLVRRNSRNVLEEQASTTLCGIGAQVQRPAEIDDFTPWRGCRKCYDAVTALERATVSGNPYWN